MLSRTRPSNRPAEGGGATSRVPLGSGTSERAFERSAKSGSALHARFMTSYRRKSRSRITCDFQKTRETTSNNYRGTSYRGRRNGSAPGEGRCRNVGVEGGRVPTIGCWRVTQGVPRLPGIRNRKIGGRSGHGRSGVRPQRTASYRWRLWSGDRPVVLSSWFP